MQGPTKSAVRLWETYNGVTIQLEPLAAPSPFIAYLGFTDGPGRAGFRLLMRQACDARVESVVLEREPEETFVHLILQQGKIMLGWQNEHLCDVLRSCPTCDIIVRGPSDVAETYSVPVRVREDATISSASGLI